MNSISIALLCGGHSRRMGEDKALLIYRGKTFIQTIVDEFQTASNVVLSLGKGRNYDVSGVEVIIDSYEECGPLGGLYSVLSTTQSDAVFFTTVDLPRVDRELLREMQKYLAPGIDAVVPVGRDGRIHPLCAIYRSSVSGQAEVQLNAGNYKVRDFLQQIRVCYVPTAVLPNGEEKLQNINTQEDYRKLLHRDEAGRNRADLDGISRNAHGIPVISTVAFSGSGKTTFLEKLIRCLKEKGVRLAVYKHDGHDFTVDKEGKDTYRFAGAGADIVLISSKAKAARMDYYPRDVYELIDEIQEVDLILMEGLKYEKFSKILLYREGAGKDAAMDVTKETPLLVVSDKKEWGEITCPIFDIDDAEQVSAFLQEKILSVEFDQMNREM